MWEENGERHLAVVDLAPMLHSLDIATKALHRGHHLDVIFRDHILECVDVDDTTQTRALVHGFNQVIDFVEAFKLMGDKFVERELTKEHLVHQLWHILTRLPSSEGGSFPDTASDELERSCLQSLSSGGDSNDA